MSGKYAGHAGQLDDRGTKSPKTRQDDYGTKYGGAHGTTVTGGPWMESPGQGGGGRGERAASFDGKIKGVNKVAP